MKASEALKLLATLKAAYPRQELGEETLEVYARDLADLDHEVAVAAVERMRKSSRFFPTIAELRESAAEIRLGAPPPRIAWGQVVAFVNHRPVWGPCPACDGSGFADIAFDVFCERCKGTCRIDTAPATPLHPEVDRARELVGDSHIWRTGDTLQLQRSFLAAYADVKAAAVAQLVAPPPELDPPPPMLELGR